MLLTVMAVQYPKREGMILVTVNNNKQIPLSRGLK